MALTFDDVLLKPGYSEVLPRDVSLSTRFSRSISLNIPLVSAAMDSVTESSTAICLAQLGGLGVIHRNLSPALQAAEVFRVKKFESGVISDPICGTETTTVREVIELTRRENISGVPVLNGDGKLCGIVTRRDLRFETGYDKCLSEVMTPRDRLVTVREGASRDEIKALLHRHRIEKLPVIDQEFYLKGLVTVKDLEKESEYPQASKDELGRLRVAAAVGTGSEFPFFLDKRIVVQGSAHPGAGESGP